MTQSSTDPRDAAIKLKESYRVLLTCHRNPDGDAIGSELAIAELAEQIIACDLPGLPGLDDLDAAAAATEQCEGRASQE